MSILESIQEAEAKAESLKLDAKQAVEKLLKESKIKVEAQVQALYEELETKKLNLNQETDNQIVSKEKELINNYLQEDEKINQIAQVNLEKTANYIIKKVLTT